MADRPIIFSAPMVRALLDGRKTQTRRVLKPQPPGDLVPGFLHVEGEPRPRVHHGRVLLCQKAPYAVGDRLWVRESIGRRPASFLGIEATNGVESAFYRADSEEVVDPSGFNICPWWRRAQPLPSIHMPRWASRLTLIVTGVKVERLKEISEEDAQAEGARHFPNLPMATATWCPNRWSMEEPPTTDHALSSARWAFANFWEKINGPGAWEANPWVVAITFTVHRCNIDSMAAAA